MSDSNGGIGRRAMLAATTAGVAGTAGCLGTGLLGGSGGLAVRFDGGDWQSVDPLVTGENHRQFYHGSDDPSPPSERAVHDFAASNAVTFLVHRNDSDGADPRDALVVTYDAQDDSGGQATLSFDESVDAESDLLVVDGSPGEGANPDEYGSNEFFHQWAPNYTDGVVISTDPFSKPTFEFADLEGIDRIRVLSAASGGDGGDGGVEELTGDPGASVGFRF